jgi:hypothetical protein
MAPPRAAEGGRDLRATTVRLELQMDGIKIHPESVQDQAYLRDVLKLRRNGDFVKLVAFVYEGKDYPLVLDLTAGVALQRRELTSRKELPRGQKRAKIKLIEDHSGRKSH